MPLLRPCVYILSFEEDLGFRGLRLRDVKGSRPRKLGLWGLGFRLEPPLLRRVNF